MSSVKKNIIFNYIGQLYTSLIGILILPFYLQHMGAEAYGLVGFFTLIQAWMSLLDLGMTPTLSREIARLKGEPSEGARLVTVVNSLEVTFIFMALLVGAGLFMSREWVASDWLTFEVLEASMVSTAIGIIAVIVSVRWVSSINRSGINAYEMQVWMSLVDVFINTLRFPGSLLLMIWTKGDILIFFYFQLSVVLIEVFLIRRKLRRLMPCGVLNSARFSWKELKRIAPFALSIGYTGVIWVLLSQLDKLLLSKVLTLGEYGYFTLIATISSGVILLAGPVSKAILPRMTALLADGKDEVMLELYRGSTRFVISVIAPVTLVIAMLPKTVVYVWTGDMEAAKWTAPILPLFVIGSGLLTIISFQYYLQYAYGLLKYHVAYNTASIIINIPLIFYAAFEYGAIGVAWIWMGFRILSLVAWVPFIHHRFAPGLHFKWLIQDVLPGVIFAAVAVWALTSFNFPAADSSRFVQFAWLVGTTLMAVSLAMGVSMRDVIRRKVLV
ncbi:hypothetical protein [uncultured Oceanisphaera sp.]|uniref:hypothetical protein n=1 Tax=uncultured Oceanisphaera sp. TaxID=353858 RepID=UPI00262B7C02|nr:hypothetical protein [uncultured Oceanisphaera sp.]